MIRLVLIGGWGISINEKMVDPQLHSRVSYPHLPYGNCHGPVRAGACYSVH
jgi:hypothetical protein